MAPEEGYRSISITDPGNTEGVITVGATYRGSALVGNESGEMVASLSAAVKAVSAGVALPANLPLSRGTARFKFYLTNPEKRLAEFFAAEKKKGKKYSVVFLDGDQMHLSWETTPYKIE